MGGGHHITREDYDVKLLEKCIQHMKETYDLDIYLEPGEAVALNAGYLVTEVMDIVENEIRTLILDASAACHMPDVLEMPYRPPLKDSGEAGEKAYTYRLSSCTCLAGDVIGDYSFDREIRIGDKLYFMDMAIYSMVKNNTFNGMPLPLIAIVALNVAAHGGLLGFLYSWAGVALGGIIMFLFWRRLIKRFFWKVASRSPKLEKAQQWVNRFDTSSLFMLSLLPFTPTSFMHFAFGMSDFDEKRYLRAVLLGKGLMVAMMAVFGQSLVSSLKNPVYLVLAVLLWGGMYWVSKRFCRKHHLE